jgi:hypothetical protein
MIIKKNDRVLYSVSSFAPIIYIILNLAQNSLQTFYSKNYELPLFSFVLSVVIPIIVSVLFYIKILLQKTMVTSFSKNLNILVTILLIAGIIIFYDTFTILYFVTTYPMLTFVFCLQLCSLTYDLFLRKP